MGASEHCNLGVSTMQNYERQTYAQPMDMSVDAGLRSFMLGVYNYMGIGLAVTGLVAYLVFSMAVTSEPSLAAGRIGSMMLTDFGRILYTTPMKWVLMLAPLAFVFGLSFGIQRASVPVAMGLFMAFAAAMGASMSTIFIIYKLGSIAQVFFITSATFGALSLYGYTTKKDLSAMGSFLMMGVIGLIIASLVNLFFQSSMMQLVISAVTVLVFAGLTAYDTQRLKEMYYEDMGHDAVAKSAIYGALSLYLDFINMFQALLSLFGSRND